MTTQTQGLVVAALAAVLIRISVTGEYLHFVLPWMRWPLIVTGLVLLALAIRPALGRQGEAGEVPRSSWLLLLPTLIVFAVAPPALGAFIAERRATQVRASVTAPDTLPRSTGAGPWDLSVDEFIWGAAQPDDPMGLTEEQVRLEGFVSTDREGRWYLTKLVIFCCAADVAVERIEMVGEPAPPRDTWVRVTGTWVTGTGREPAEPARLTVVRLVEIPEPESPYDV